jgi:hypothetical protein
LRTSADSQSGENLFTSLVTSGMFTDFRHLLAHKPAVKASIGLHRLNLFCRGKKSLHEKQVGFQARRGSDFGRPGPAIHTLKTSEQAKHGPLWHRAALRTRQRPRLRSGG